MIEVKDNETIRVENYGLIEWLTDLQQQIKLGYEIDFSTNEGYPQSFGSVYTCLMKKQQENVSFVMDSLVIDSGVTSLNLVPSVNTTTPLQVVVDDAPSMFVTQVKRGPKSKQSKEG